MSPACVLSTEYSLLFLNIKHSHLFKIESVPDKLFIRLPRIVNV